MRGYNNEKSKYLGLKEQVILWLFSCKQQNYEMLSERVLHIWPWLARKEVATNPVHFLVWLVAMFLRLTLSTKLPVSPNQLSLQLFIFGLSEPEIYMLLGHIKALKCTLIPLFPVLTSSSLNRKYLVLFVWICLRSVFSFVMHLSSN